MAQIKGMISARQLILIIALSRIPVMTVYMPVITSADALQDAWFSVILATVGGVILGALAGLLAMRFPYQSFGTSAKKSLGKVLGTAGLLIFGFYYYLLSLSRTREVSLIIVSTLLPNTPTWIIASSILIAAVYGVILGADTLGRSAEILMTIVGITIITGFLLLFISGTEDISLLRPVLSRGIQPVAVATVQPIFEFVTSAATVLALGKFCRRPQGMLKAVTTATIISGIILFFLVIVVTITLGPNEAQRQLSPMLSLARTIFIEGIFERIDILLISLWVLGIIFEVTLYFFTALVILSDGLGLKVENTAISLFVLGIPPTVLRYTDMFTFIEINSPLYPGIAIMVIHLLLVGLVLLVAVLRGKGGSNEKV